MIKSNEREKIEKLKEMYWKDVLSKRLELRHEKNALYMTLLGNMQLHNYNIEIGVSNKEKRTLEDQYNLRSPYGYSSLELGVIRALGWDHANMYKLGLPDFVKKEIDILHGKIREVVDVHTNLKTFYD